MSSDNYILVRKKDNLYYVSDESASSDEPSPIGEGWCEVFGNKEEALDYAYSQYSEYGVRFVDKGSVSPLTVENSGRCNCTHCYHTTASEQPYNASESILVDPANPPHYARLTPQPVELINDWGLDYLEGSVIKYLSRWRHKNGVEDLHKAKRFLEMLIERES